MNYLFANCVIAPLKNAPAVFRFKKFCAQNFNGGQQKPVTHPTFKMVGYKKPVTHPFHALNT